jgi:hypothetical protein
MDELVSIFPNEPDCHFYKVINGVIMTLGSTYLYRTVDNTMELFESITRFVNATHVPSQSALLQNKTPMVNPYQTFLGLIEKHWKCGSYQYSISSQFTPHITINRTYIYERAAYTFNTFIKCQLICNNIFSYIFYVDRMFMRAGFNEITVLYCLECKHSTADEKTAYLDVSRETMRRRVTKLIAKYGYSYMGTAFTKEKVSAIGVRYTIQFTRSCVIFSAPEKCMYYAIYSDCINFAYWDGIDPFLDLSIQRLPQHEQKYVKYKVSVSAALNTHLYADVSKIISGYMNLA